MIKKIVIYFIWLQALAATLGSLYADLFLKLAPCVLCWYQRIFMFPLVIIIGIGIWKKIKHLNYLVLPLSLAGASIAFYHNLLQYGIITEKITTCSLVTPCVSNDPLPLGFISLPLLSLIAFIFISLGIIIYSHLNKLPPKTKGEDEDQNL